MFTLCHLARIRNVNIKLEPEVPMSLNFLPDLMETPIYSAQEQALGNVRDLLFAKWNAGDLPVEVGMHESVEFVENPCQIEGPAGFVRIRLYADLEVAYGRYVGTFTPEQVAVLDGRSEEEVEMPDIANAWEELEEGVPDPEAEAYITVVMQY
jgi:hypothetical protein